MTIRITLHSPPRTKKNSAQIIPGMKHQMLVPSAAYTEWFKEVLKQRPLIQQQLAGIAPIDKPVAIAATVYREALQGDWTGYVEAIADAIQEEVWSCEGCGKRATTAKPSACVHCGHWKVKRTRKGLGIILDDKQIVHWDGTRLAKDAKNPRIELALTILADPTPPQQGLFELQQEQEQELEEVAL